MHGKDNIELICFDKWYNAVRQDDFSYISKTLREADGELKQHLVNAEFDKFGSEAVNRELKKFNLHALGNIQITLAWHLILTVGSFKNIDLFLEFGVDVCATDDKMQNGLHYLVLLSHLEPDLEGKMIEHYRHLEAKISKEQLKEMLMQENIQGLRPLELAMNVGSLGICEGRLFKKYYC